MGTHVETAGADTSSIQSSQSIVVNAVKGIRLHVFAEPIIPKGRNSFEGPITLWVVENKGQCCEFEHKFMGDG